MWLRCGDGEQFAPIYVKKQLHSLLSTKDTTVRSSTRR
jgi:hypothetical protein